MLNRVVIVGRMTRDPELNRTNGGNSVCHFTLALERNFKSGEEQQADFIPVVVWNKNAENVAKYCGKGSLVGVDGQLRSRSYENKDGRRVFVVEVRADSVQFLETRAARERKQANAASNNFYNAPQFNTAGNDHPQNFNNAGNYNNQQSSANRAGNFYNGQQNAQTAGNNQQASPHNRQFNTAGNVNQNQPAKSQVQNQNKDFHDMNGFDDAVNKYNIMDDDIQF